MSQQFVHLRLHSEYSLSDGLIRLPPLVNAVADQGMAAVALTDRCNLFGLIKFYRAALAAGVKPIVGAEFEVRTDMHGQDRHRCVLLARDDNGYRNLKRLISRAYQQGQVLGEPTLQREWIFAAAEGLIALSGGQAGELGMALLNAPAAECRRIAEDWRQAFAGDFFIEVHRLGRPDDETHLHAAVELATALSMPVVATNDARFLTQGDFEAHEVKVCIQQGRVLSDPRRPRQYTDQQYLRSSDDMAALFADLPEALDNTVRIAQRCNVGLKLDEAFLPDFPVPGGLSMNEFFVQASRTGLEARLDTLLQREAADFAERRAPYDRRLQTELDVIVPMGFAGYFMIVADFIQWAKDHAVPVGPGRGSGAGSLVAYALKITDLDPLRYDLLFERFLNPERVSMPDFDVDFCMEGRDRVIDYVSDKYGRDKVAQIATHGTMAAKAVVRDVGRAMGQPFGFVDRIAKLIPFEIGMTLDKALAQEEDLRNAYEQEDEVKDIITMARALEGLARNVGRHAGGVVIAPTALTDFAPLYLEAGAESGVITQFDKDDVEAVGLVKFDFLGLRTLTIIDWALQTVNAHRRRNAEPPLDIAAIPLDDAGAFEVLKAAQTTAVFQLESHGMKKLIVKLKPDTFEDIVALVALYRPGPLGSGMVDDFIARKHGKQAISYPHPALETILKPTYGTILYQEQVMQIAQVLAGYSLGGADLLRRAMGKKKAEVMDAQRATFVQGAVDNGVPQAKATEIFDLMAEFAKYGFNKSHSAAYALISYQTAWLKHHYPAAFMAAVLSSDMDNTDKVVVFIEACRDIGITVLPPDVNASAYRFTVAHPDAGQHAVLYGLGALKGVGEAAIEGILEERDARGVFKDVFDFCDRIDLRKANKRVLEAMIHGGALDALGPNRASLVDWLPEALKIAEQRATERDSGQNDLFGEVLAGESDDPQLASSRSVSAEWDDDVKLGYEKTTLGLYLTGHPVSRYLDELQRMKTTKLSVLAEGGNDGGAPETKRRGSGQMVRCAGLVMEQRTRRMRNAKVTLLTLDDRGGRLEVKLSEDTAERFRDAIGKERIVVVEGKLVFDEFNDAYQVTAETLFNLSQARAKFAKCVELDITAGRGEALVTELKQAITPYRCGAERPEPGCRVRVNYRRDEARASIPLGEHWQVEPAEALLAELHQIAEVDAARVVY